MLPDIKAETPLSVQTSALVIEGWRVGGAALGLLIVGVTLLISASASALAGVPWYVSIALIIVGAGIVTLIGYRVYIEVIVPARDVRKNIELNAALLDGVQQAGLQLTFIIGQINDYALINAERLVIVTQGLIKLADLPGLSNIINLERFKDVDKFSKSIRTVSLRSREIVGEVQDSISRADGTKILVHVQELKVFKEFLETELLHSQR
jgi:hypothetical protein